MWQQTYEKVNDQDDFSIDIEKIGADIVISYTGDGFLQNMIRIITGTLIEVGDGRKNPDAVMEILASRIGHRQATQHRRVG